MKTTISFRALTIALLIALFISYILCIAGDLLFGWRMYQAWMPLLPGFTWPLTAGGFVIGLVWLALFSLYVSALITLPYNYIIRRQPQA